MFLGCGRKPEDPEETYSDMQENMWNSRAEELRNLELWVIGHHNTNCLDIHIHNTEYSDAYYVSFSLVIRSNPWSCDIKKSLYDFANIVYENVE